MHTGSKGVVKGRWGLWTCPYQLAQHGSITMLVVMRTLTQPAQLSPSAAVPAILLYGCGPPSRPASVSETLPTAVTNREFWEMITEFSEPQGSFPSDNFVSNESGYQEVIPMVLNKVKPGG